MEPNPSGRLALQLKQPRPLLPGKPLESKLPALILFCLVNLAYKRSKFLYKICSFKRGRVSSELK